MQEVFKMARMSAATPLEPVSSTDMPSTNNVDRCKRSNSELSVDYLAMLASIVIAEWDIEKSEKSTAYKSSKPKQESSCRLLPKHATDILKDWILSPENFGHPYPTEIEKKMLMEKTGINSKQLKYWFTNARRRLWKQKFMEQNQVSNVHNISNIPSYNNASKINPAPKPLLNTIASNINNPPLLNNIPLLPLHVTAAQNNQVALLHQQAILQRLVPRLINKAFPNPAGIAHHDSIGNLQRIISIRNYNSNGHDFIKRSSPTLNLTQPMPNQFNGV